MPSEGGPAAPGNTTAPLSGDEPATYRTGAGLGAPHEGSDILLIQTNDPWERSGYYIGNNWYDGITADTRVLDTLGYTYRIATWSDIEGGAVNVFAYPVVLIVNDQVQAFYDNYASHVAEFERYVSEGHILVFFSAGGGWAQGVLGAALPGGVRWNYVDWDTTAAYRNVVADSTHPIVTAELSNRTPLVDADLYNNKTSHGYFTSLPAGARTILRESASEGGRPTLVEYPLGRGRVIASTLTWEHNWAHWGGSQYGYFAQKALDDVFLYAFSGGAVPAEVKLDLRVEDAPNWVEVNKSRGSYLDVVARVTGDEAYDIRVVLQVPADKLGAPHKTFTRDRADNAGFGQENQYTRPGAGQYQIESALQPWAGQHYKEIVWRFRVPDSAAVEQGLELVATISVPGHTVQNPTNSTKLNITDYARSLIVTNRALLFSKYQPDPAHNDVSALLEEIYRQAMVFEGEVFYVELYDNSVANWDQTTNETTANSVVEAVDELIEGWFNRLTRHPHPWETIRPEFLLIVGGDEIIPFWRAHAPDYGDNDEDTVPDSCPNPDPVLDALCDEYFLSDSIYAKVGGSQDDWETGNTDWSMGRIVGASASDMLHFVESASLDSQPLQAAVFASLAGSQVDGMKQRLDTRHVEISGLQNPVMVDNNNWTRAQWLTAWEDSWQLNYYGGHGSYDHIPGPGWGANAIHMADLPAGHVEENHPLFISDACNLGVPTDQDGAAWQPQANDSVMYKLASLGTAGMVASNGISSFDSGRGTKFGERLINDYVEYLIDTASWLGLVPASAYSEYFGTALRKAKGNYSPNGLLWTFNGADKKTMLEYVYYGLPWSFMETPDNAAAQRSAAVKSPTGYAFAMAAPQALKQGALSRIVTATVGAYQFVAVNGFELLDVPGSDNLYSFQRPILPIIFTGFDLPPGATVSEIALVSQQSTALGSHNIPAADPATQYHPTTGYTQVTGVTGEYPPAPRYAYRVTDRGDRVEVQISVIPASFNVDTRQVSLYTSTVLRINYNTPGPLVISDLKLQKPQFRVGEPLTPIAGINNVGSRAVTSVARATLYGADGAQVATMTSNPFTVAAGNSYLLKLPWTLSVDPAAYQLALSVEEAGTPLVSSVKAVIIEAGRISAFEVPKLVVYGQYSQFNLSFINYRDTPINAAAKVHIYNSHAVEVTSLLQRTFPVGAGATGTTTWSWNPAGLSEGTYTARAVVRVGDKVYTSLAYELSVRKTQAFIAAYIPVLVRNYGTGPSQWLQGAGVTDRIVYRLAASSANCSRLFAGTDNGVYRSLDDGQTWSPLSVASQGAVLQRRPFDGEADPDSNLTPAVAVCPANPNVIYLTRWGEGVYRSTDGGATWQPRNGGLSDLWVYDLAVHPTDCNTLYIATNSTGVFKTSDGGGFWQARNGGLGNLNGRSLAMAPSDPNRLYVGTANGVYRSDNGEGWWNATGSLPGVTAWALAVAPGDANTVYAGLDGYGVYKSTSGGSAWQAQNAGLGNVKARALIVDPTDAQTVYVGRDDGGGVYRSLDGAGSWSELNQGLNSRTVKALWLDGGSCRTLHAGTTNGAWYYER